MKKLFLIASVLVSALAQVPTWADDSFGNSNLEVSTDVTRGCNSCHTNNNNFFANTNHVNSNNNGCASNGNCGISNFANCNGDTGCKIGCGVTHTAKAARVNVCPEPLVQPAGPLILGVDFTTFPLDNQAFINPITGQVDGYLVRIACIVAQTLGRELVIKNIPASQLLAAVQFGAVDLTGNFFRTPGRLAIFEQIPNEYTQSLQFLPIVFGATVPAGISPTTNTTGSSNVANADYLLQISNLPAGSNRTVAAAANSIQQSLVQAAIAAGYNITLLTTATFAEARAAVTAGTAVAAVTNDNPATPLAGFTVLKTALIAGFPSIVSSIVTRRNDCTLINQIANVLRTLDANGTLRPLFLATVAVAQQLQPADLLATLPVFTPQICPNEVFNPFETNCPLITAINAKYCGVGSCNPQIINLQ